MRLLDLYFSTSLRVGHYTNKLRIRCLCEIHFLNSVQRTIITSYYCFTFELAAYFVLELNFSSQWQILLNVLHQVEGCLKSYDQVIGIQVEHWHLINPLNRVLKPWPNL